MSALFTSNKRVVSGMRVSGRLHLGHYHGVLKNWIKLQHQYDCFFFAADWHGLTTQYEQTGSIEQHLWDMIIDWLACGINPGLSKIFIQSWVPEHAELHLLLSMITPMGWLERVPTYKDQQEKLKEKDLSTYGFLGYPLLQSADVLLYHANYVPVGEDQVAHIELTREIARRFNHIYGKEPNFEELKAQLSFLVPIIHHLIENRPLALNFAYTQLMYWQVYAKSQYFRETNYEPELFIENYFNSNLAAQLGVNHQSNGRGGPLERSWNRAYLQFKFSGKNWLTHIRGWALLGQNVSSDIHNPDIAHFLGYENVLFSYNFMNLKASVELQNIESGLRRGFVQATLSYPILKSLSIYAQFFNGYGQSLIEYNHRTTSGGIGFALNDWIN